MQSIGPPRIQLTIRRRGDLNTVELDTGGPLIHESAIRVDETLLRGLIAQMARLAMPSYAPSGRERACGDSSRGKANTTARRLQVLGEQIFSQLLPQSAREQLHTAAPSDLFLHVDEQLLPIPWELCHDGTDFLAAKFRVGRHVRVRRQIPWTATERVETGLLKVLLIADPTESLPQAAQEAEQLCQLLDSVPKVKVTLLGGKRVSKAEILISLLAHDIAHFAGHSHYDPVQPSRSGWHLHEGVLDAEELSTLSRSPLLVFSNSCQAGASGGGRYQYDRHALGIGGALLTAGVKNYLGAFWAVHDEESRDFAVAFYKGLALGLSLGEALLRARLEIRGQSGGEGLTWASYLLYGDPSVTFFPVADVVPTPVSLPERMVKQEVSIKTIVVRPFAALNADPQLAWLKGAEVISCRLQSALSRVPGLKIYPSEHFKWLLQQRHLSAIELAGNLGISKMICGSFLVEGNLVRLEAHPEDVESVTHEPSDEAQGEPEDFFDCIQELAAKITRRLTLKPEEQPGTFASLSEPWGLSSPGLLGNESNLLGH